MFEHILVMEEYLGRPTTTTERIHHKDGNRQNNNIDNLVLCADNKEHKKFHRSITGVNCIVCHGTNIRDAGIRLGRQRYRCIDCNRWFMLEYKHRLKINQAYSGITLVV